ncbi:MAG: hypothetical protein OEV15_02885 [Gallionella sp.]|nr:hypothetical protein [Gallionella sp.]
MIPEKNNRATDYFGLFRIINVLRILGWLQFFGLIQGDYQLPWQDGMALY